MSLTSYRTAPPRDWVGLLTGIGRLARERAPARDREEKSSRVTTFASVLGRPGSDQLSQALRLSTMGAEGFNGRVRNGIGFGPHARATRPAKHRQRTKRAFPRATSPTLVFPSLRTSRPANDWRAGID